MTDQTRDEKAIFLNALERSTFEEQRAYLEEACEGNSELFARVMVLLKSHHDSLGPLDSPHPEFQVTNISPVTENSGDTIGPYKLLQQLGEGGMGVVYMAEQTHPVERRVALKIIKPGMDTRQVIARFEAERQALAMMDHPNIAKVLDVGTTESGRPYFVMELVKGISVTQYCDDKRLTLQQRLHLFVPICLAVQHAHQKGIIHRDLKPSNILIAQYDDKPVPKIIDFGVAKAISHNLTERTMFTQYGQIVGTIEYMSPEQAQFNQLDVDTRSDVYSLGVLLYELLTGETPFDKRRLRSAAFDELLRIIREEEPPRPSTRLSSSETLPNIAVHRGIEPRKLSLLVRGELDWIVMKALEKDRNRRYETANGFAGDILKYLANEPVSACPPSSVYRLRKFVRRNRTALSISTVLMLAIFVAIGTIGWAVRDRAARQHEAVIERENRELKLSGDLKFALERADLLQQQGKRAEAFAALERLYLLSREITPETKDQERIADLRERLAAEQDDLEFISRFENIRLVEQSRYDEARNVFMVASAYPKLCEAFADYGIPIGISPAEQTISKIRSRPTDVQTPLLAALHECLMQSPRDAVETHQWINGVLKTSDSDAWRVRAREAWEQKQYQTLRQLATEVDVRLQPPGFLVWLAKILRRQSEEQTVNFSQRIVDAYPGDFWAHENLGSNLLQTDKSDEAIRYYTAAIALRPENPVILVMLGLCLQSSGKYVPAVAFYQRAIAVEPKHSNAYAGLGRCFQLMGRLDDAVASCRTAIEIDPQYAYAYNFLGLALDDQGKTEEAIECFRKAIELDPQYPDPVCNLGVRYLNTDRNQEAIACFLNAIKINPKHVQAYVNYANILHQQEQRDEANVYYLKAIELNPYDAIAYTNLGINLKKQEKYDDAIHYLRKAIEIDPKLTTAYITLGNVFLTLARTDESIDCFVNALDLKPTNELANRRLAETLAELKDWDKYTARFNATVRLNPAGEGAKIGLALCLNKQAVLLEFSREIELHPDQWEPWNKRAWAYFERNLWELAIADFSEAIQRAPEVHTNWFHRGHSYLKLGEWDKAATDFTQIVEGWPEESSGWYLRAQAYARMNQPDKAIADLRQAVAKGFNNSEQMKTDPQFNLLRSNDEFQKLLAEMEAKLD